MDLGGRARQPLGEEGTPGLESLAGASSRLPRDASGL